MTTGGGLVYTRGWHGNGVDKYPGTAATSDFVVVVAAAGSSFVILPSIPPCVAL